MKAMIFAAGLGTRLRPLTDTMPKALVPVAGKPMLEHVIGKLKAAGYDELVVNIHHLGEQIVDFLRTNNDFGMTIRISDERDALLDTGGGLARAASLLFPMTEATPAEDCALVHNVDILSNCDLNQLMEHHRSSDAGATLLVSKRETARYLLFDADGYLCGWVNKKTLETKPAGFRYEEGKYREYAFSGIQVVDAAFCRQMPQGKYSVIDYYLSIASRREVRCYVQDGLQLMDIGKPETLEKAEEFLAL